MAKAKSKKVAKPVEGEVVSAPLQMIQSRDHPHYGELGWMDKEQYQHTTGQYYFKLSNCQHGVAGCYVLESDLTDPNKPEQTQENLTNLTPFDPYKYTETTRDKLVEAFEKLYNVSEACQYVGISRETYYQWLKEIDGLEAIIEEAKARPLKAAKGLLRTAIASGDTSTAKWLLERKDPEFKPKAEVDNNIGVQETRKKIAEFLDDDDSTDAISEQPTATPADATTDEVATTPTDIS